MPSRLLSVLLGRAIGIVWLAAHGSVLYLVATPWRELGGLIDERTRWYGWFVLSSGVLMGQAIASHLRDRQPPRHPVAWLRLWRRLLYPAGLLTGVGLVFAALAGREAWVDLIWTGFQAYWAGADAALAAFPLLRGRFLEQDESPPPSFWRRPGDRVKS